MLKLHGFASSNYHNLVKVVLIEKGVDFEEVTAYPPADAAYQAKSPTGKYPCLETEDGDFLGESKVILGFLDEAYPATPLLPADAISRARVRELMEIVDLYLELPARRLYPEALFAERITDEVKAAALEDLKRGIAGLEDRARFEPYIAGLELTLADFSAAIHLPMVSIATRAVYGEDLLDSIPAARQHRTMMGERSSLKRIKAERRADVPKFMQHREPAG